MEEWVIWPEAWHIILGASAVFALFEFILVNITFREEIRTKKLGFENKALARKLFSEYLNGTKKWEAVALRITILDHDFAVKNFEPVIKKYVKEKIKNPEEFFEKVRTYMKIENSSKYSFKEQINIKRNMFSEEEDGYLGCVYYACPEELRDRIIGGRY